MDQGDIDRRLRRAVTLVVSVCALVVALALMAVADGNGTPLRASTALGPFLGAGRDPALTPVDVPTTRPGAIRTRPPSPTSTIPAPAIDPSPPVRDTPATLIVGRFEPNPSSADPTPTTAAPTVTPPKSPTPTTRPPSSPPPTTTPPDKPPTTTPPTTTPPTTVPPITAGYGDGHDGGGDPGHHDGHDDDHDHSDHGHGHHDDHGDGDGDHDGPGGDCPGGRRS